MMLSTLLQCCIVIVMQIKLTVVVVVVKKKTNLKIVALSFCEKYIRKIVLLNSATRQLVRIMEISGLMSIDPFTVPSAILE